MASLERKEYISQYYSEFVTFVKLLASDKSNILHIAINDCRIRTWKVKWADEILIKWIKDLFNKALLEVEKEIVADLKQ